jgi:hypothetical protein
MKKKVKVKLSLCFTKGYILNTYLGMDVQIYIFSTLASVVLHGLATLLLRKTPTVPFAWDAECAPDLVWMTWRLLEL